MHYQKPPKVLKTFSTLQKIMKSNENGKCILKNIKKTLQTLNTLQQFIQNS